MTQALDRVNFTKPVQVYRNLNCDGCKFSVRQSIMVNGKSRLRVLGHVESIVLINCKFKHATANQLSEVRTGARQVCQWITGTIATESTWTTTDASLKRVSCDPKKTDGFQINGAQIDSAEFVALSANGCFAR